MTDCIYRGTLAGDALHNGAPIYKCQLFKHCVLGDGDAAMPGCNTCAKATTSDAPGFVDTWVDPLGIVSRDKSPTTALRNLLAGRSAFLLGGGPSAKGLDLSQLTARGMWAMAVNNMAAKPGYRPNAFVCSDPPRKFSDSIWLDPGIMKFVPVIKLGRGRDRGRLRTRNAGGELVWLKNVQNGKDMCAIDCPNVWGFRRRSWLSIDDTFFTDDHASWGNQAEGVTKVGATDRTACTLLLGLRLLKYLGAKRVFLLGVDFQMDPGRPLTENYAFPEERTVENCVENNRQFAITNEWLCGLVQAGVFQRFGMEIFNCNPISGLRAFPSIPYEGALAYVQQGVDPNPDLQGWY